MPISSLRWEAYPWKNELKLQSDRVLVHLGEALDDDFAGDHNPMDMLERSLILAAFCMRRMIEKRLVTDALSARSIEVRSFPARTETFRTPFHGASGGSAYSSYRFGKPEMIGMRIKNLADEIIHSSQLMVIGEDERVAAGLLIASDRHLNRRLLHLVPVELDAHVQSILEDRIGAAADSWDPATGKVTSTRT